MKKLLLLTVFLSVLVACGGRKQTEKALNSGNYDQAISNALKRLSNNKDKKRKQEFIILLEDAYQKVIARDLRTIDGLKKDGNPEFYKSIYETYLSLNSRQEAIKPVLPLYIDNRSINLDFKDYTKDIIDYRYKVSDFLTDKGLDLLDTNNKYNAKEAYELLSYVEQINPNFEDVRDLMAEAHRKGTDYVFVSIENQTNQIIPKRLEDELLDFDTYGLNKFWTEYHASKAKDVNYNYEMELQLRQINISPERVYEKEYIREKEIIDGWEYKKDRRGNVVKDSLGNDIKLDKIITVTCGFYEFTQSKATQVIAKVVYSDKNTNQVLDDFTIDSEFVFENIYAEIEGDRRALNKDDRYILKNNRIVDFPSNEQMVYDTGEDLKQKLKNIIRSYNFK
ncbi:hypothetical protein D7030_05220 [Flavobacteriaceae bacterium AU392]|nr:hypothetical protein D1817_11695 [Flavobacteriaceae bacterium]RKM86077.1 hypothetical protein D7030_05220 [Flavobacteriaceae bacterium AU392]